MGFFDAIRRGWRLSLLSWKAVRADPEMLVYTILSGIMVLATTVAAALPSALEMAWTVTEEGAMSVAYMVWIFCAYMGGSIAVVFWNAAIIHNAHSRFNGGEPTFFEGIGASFSVLPAIIAWGIISGTVGLLLKMIRNQSRESNSGGLAILFMVISYILEIAWWMMTFFVIPIVVLEKKGVFAGIREGKELFKRTWGENVVSGMGISLITFLLVIVAAVIGFGLGIVNVWAGIAVGGFIAILAIIWGSTAEVVAKAALYDFATQGKMPELWRQEGMSEFNFNR